MSAINPVQSMRAAVWHGRNDIRVEDVPLPVAPPNWAPLHDAIGVSVPRKMPESLVSV